MRRNEQVYARPAARVDGDGQLEVRASAAGGCRRALWYAATGWAPTNPPSDEALTVMEAGNALEPVVLRAMERAGWDVVPADPEDPGPVSVRVAPGLTVTGHPDATGRMPVFGGKEVIVEVKTRGPDAYKRWRTLGAERSHPESVAQAALYTYGAFGEARDAVIATMDTGSRAWDTEVIPAERVETAMAATRSRLGELAAHHALRGEDPAVLPERDFPADSWQCRRCPFLDMCLPGATEARTPETPETEERQVSTAEAKAAVAAYAEARDALKAPDQAKRRALDTLQAWMRHRGTDRETLDAGGVNRTVSLVRTTRYAVDHKRLNALLDAEARAAVVTEHDAAHVRVS